MELDPSCVIRDGTCLCAYVHLTCLLTVCLESVLTNGEQLVVTTTLDPQETI